jgi:hypothetical protein
MLVPFGLIPFMDQSDDAVEHVIGWANTVLPPVVGFGGAIVGYYFGSRADQTAAGADETEGGEDE